MRQGGGSGRASCPLYRPKGYKGGGGGEAADGGMGRDPMIPPPLCGTPLKTSVRC